MAGKSVSGYVDESVANRLASVAQMEARTPASVVGQATSFYISLPEIARTALRRLEHDSTDAERSWFESQLIRLFVQADFALTQRQMAKEAQDALPDGDSEAELEAAALEWTASSRR